MRRILLLPLLWVPQVLAQPPSVRPEAAASPTAQQPLPAVQPLLVPRPRLPYRVVDHCPFEYGCTFGLWQTCESLPVRRAPDAAAPTAYRLAPQEHFRARRADMVVTRAGRVRIEYPLPADRPHGWPTLPIGTEVDVLDGGAEGVTTVWVQGRLWTVERFWSRTPSPRWPGRLLAPPAMTWWVEVETLGGQRGWLGLRNTAPDAEGIAFNEVIRMGDATAEGPTPGCSELRRPEE